MKKVGRNEMCPCGSGKKYKNCHQQIESKKGAREQTFIIGGIIVLFIIFAIVGFYINSQSSGTKSPGNAQKGQVWSEEHGHWHNAE